METKKETRFIETVEGTGILQLPITGFEILSLHEKQLLYHLWHAAVAGDSITYDQNYRYGLQLRDFFLDLLEHKPVMSESFYHQLETYTKKLLIHHGNHDARSTRKFVPLFTDEELKNTLKNAHGFPHQYTETLSRIIFDPSFEPQLTVKNPQKGDIITESNNNFYQNVTLNEIEQFKEQFPQNSTVLKKDGIIAEDVWRAGNRAVPAGRYAKQLKNVIHHLTEAKRYAHEHQQQSIQLLINYFEEGFSKHFDDYNIHWIKTDPMVDTILGFIEEYQDARGMKALYEGMLFYKDVQLNDTIKRIADHAQHFENHAPWKPEYKKTWASIPVSNAIVQVLGCGGAGPLCWAGVNLPNAQWIKEQHGSKSILVSNITFASRNVKSNDVINEFIEREEDKELLNAYWMTRGPIMVTLHEIIGHGSGKVASHLKGDPRDHLKETYAAMEETRAELCALYHIWDPLLQDIGVVPDHHCVKAAYLGYINGYLLILRRQTDEIHEDHDRSISIIVRYLLEQGSAELYTKNGKTYPRVKDYDLMYKQIGLFLGEIMRIKAEGDYEAMVKIVDRYGRKFDPALRDEIAARCASIEYPHDFAYLQTYPELVTDASGSVVDITLKPYPDIIAQGIHWRELGG